MAASITPVNRIGHSAIEVAILYQVNALVGFMKRR